MQDILHFEKIFTQSIHANWLPSSVQLDVLRLDKIHSIISGNKWFKLKCYLEEAKRQHCETIATFGGAYSNHIVASAFACRLEGFKSIGIIRGERPAVLSDTLLCAAEYGMQLEFVNRTLYKETEIIKKHFRDAYWIDEGGYGKQGMEGAKEILPLCEHPEKYAHIICAVGTGTMMAGIIKAAGKNQHVIGISVMRGNFSLTEKVRDLLDEDDGKSFSILHDYHFGGYAKHPPELIQFMNETWEQYQLPTDIVYTSKTFYAAQQLIVNHTIPEGSNVLMIHSGGLQGNLSLPEKTLRF